MESTFQGVLAKRRDRLIATILGAKEDLCDPYIPKEVSDEFRKVVLDQVNDYADLCFDLLKSLDNGAVVINEEFINKIDRILDRL